MAPDSAIGPTVNGAIIELYSAPPAPPVPPQSRRASAGDQACTGVPPQLDEIRPIGTLRDCCIWRPKRKQAAEKSSHARPPTVALVAAAHGLRHDRPPGHAWVGRGTSGLSRVKGREQSVL